MSTSRAGATVILVHGAWHGAWAFSRVVPLLEAIGVHVVARDLPGHGASSLPLSDLHGDADSVTKILDNLDGPAILVGHSYGGTVITEAGHHDAVRHLVYLCANVPDDESSEVPKEVPNDTTDDQQGLMSELITHSDGTTTVPRLTAARYFYNDCDDTTATWAAAQLGAQPMTNLWQRPLHAAWRSKPSTYALCLNDQVVPVAVQRLLARRCTDTIEWNAGHSPFLAQPALIVDLLASSLVRYI